MRIDQRRRDANELAFTDEDFMTVASYAADRYGIRVDRVKKDLIYARLSRRMRKLNMDDFSLYFSKIVGGVDDVEIDAFVSLLTTNVTSFFREAHHFELLEKEIRSRFEKGVACPKIRIWSAACSTGQEAYSISAVMQKLLKEFQYLRFEIFASDLDSSVLEEARRGEYQVREVCEIDDTWKGEIFEKDFDVGEYTTVRTKIRENLTFEKINLVSDWGELEDFDFIFCRNVTIYFERDVQRRLYERFLKNMQSKGVLFLGQSERLPREMEKEMKCIGQTAYKRNS